MFEFETGPAALVVAVAEDGLFRRMLLTCKEQREEEEEEEEEGQCNHSSSVSVCLSVYVMERDRRCEYMSVSAQSCV